MSDACQNFSGKTTLVYQGSSDEAPLTMYLPESDISTFKLMAPKINLLMEKELKRNQPQSSSEAIIFEKPISTFPAVEDESTNQLSHTNAQINAERQAGMSQMTREELQAHLDKNKAEMQALASGVREDMAKWSQANSEQLSRLTVSIDSLSSKIDGKIEATNGKLEGLQGQINGLNTAISGVSTGISGIQSGLSTKLTVFGIIITVVIALVGFGAAMFGKSGADQPLPNQNPIIIQVPPQNPLATSSPGESAPHSNSNPSKTGK